MGISSSRTEVPPGAKSVVVDNSEHSGIRLADINLDDASRTILTGLSIVVVIWMLVKLARFVRRLRKKKSMRRKAMINRMELIEQGNAPPQPPAPPPTPVVFPIQALMPPPRPSVMPSTTVIESGEAPVDLSRQEQMFWSRLNAAR